MLLSSNVIARVDGCLVTHTPSIKVVITTWPLCPHLLSKEVADDL